jgi:hypothetical protein
VDDYVLEQMKAKHIPSLELVVIKGQAALLRAPKRRIECAERRRQDLLSLAREALDSNFDGWKIIKYEVAERAAKAWCHTASEDER